MSSGQDSPDRTFKYGVVGVRDLCGVKYTNYQYIVKIMERHIRNEGHSFNNISVVTGGGAGVERLVVDWCETRGIPCECIPPNIKELGKPRAFIARNNSIAAKCDDLIVFWDGQVRFMLNCVTTAAHMERRSVIYPLK